MNKKPFRVAHIDRPMYPSFNEILDAAPDIEQVRIALSDSESAIRAALASCHGYYVMASRDELPRSWHVNAGLLATMPSLLIVASYGAGYDTIDVQACTEAGVAAVNQAGGNAQAVAEHAVGMMMTLLKRIPEAQRAIYAGTAGRREALMGRELSGKTVGVIGLGHTGSRTTSIVKAFGCRVLAYDPYLDSATCVQRGATKTELETLLPACDIISVHCPLSAETRNLFDAGRFVAMRPAAIFVNTARGSTYDEAALHRALVAGHLAGAGLDVWEQEPPPPDHPLLRHPAVLASSHMAGVTHESRDRVARMAAEAFVAVAAGQMPQRLLNPEVSGRFRARFQTWQTENTKRPTEAGGLSSRSV
jgi:D-3-phosphoglycerate dehydrogenase